jgi:hypothetical protein
MATFNGTRSKLNNSIGNDPKIDGAIIYSHIKLINIASQPYLTQMERKYKYYQMKDLIFIYIIPALVPKVTRMDWAERYFKIKKHIEEKQKIESNLDYFQFLLEEAMILTDTILYSNNYYMLEDISDADFEEMRRMGDVELGH